MRSKLAYLCLLLGALGLIVGEPYGLLTILALLCSVAWLALVIRDGRRMVAQADRELDR